MDYRLKPAGSCEIKLTTLAAAAIRELLPRLVDWSINTNSQD